jgi:hypothetical protein
MRDNSNDASTAEISLLAVCINSLVHIDFAVAPVDSSAQFHLSNIPDFTHRVGVPMEMSLLLYQKVIQRTPLLKKFFP